jgi:hypothetical protein
MHDVCTYAHTYIFILRGPPYDDTSRHTRHQISNEHNSQLRTPNSCFTTRNSQLHCQHNIQHQYNSKTNVPRQFLNSTEMINWRLNVAQPAAAVILPADINLRALPGGIDPAIQQPTDDTVQFTWIVSKTLGNNEYQCKLCDACFCGQPSKVGSHFHAEFSSQRTKLCRHAGNLPDILKQQIQRAIKTKKRKIIDIRTTLPS